ncbi:MAG: phage protein GemA/Gp16 family protein [Methylococcales bacterium]
MFKTPRAEIRNLQLAKIHIAKKQLGLDDETYQDLIKKVAGIKPDVYVTAVGKKHPQVISARHLTVTGLRILLCELKSAGFKTKIAIKGRPHNIDSETSPTASQLKKVEALLADAKRPWAYAEAMALRMYKKQTMTFCNHKELSGIITALTKDAKKREVEHDAE